MPVYNIFALFSILHFGQLHMSCADNYHFIAGLNTMAYTPCLEKNGTNNVLGITLTKFNKFPQFLAQFMLTCQLTKKL